MGENMITSFDGTKLYLKKETAADNKAVIVIVHGLCEHQGRYDYFAEKLYEVGIGTYRLITEDMDDPKVRRLFIRILMNFWMIPM